MIIEYLRSPQVLNSMKNSGTRTKTKDTNSRDQRPNKSFLWIAISEIKLRIFTSASCASFFKYLNLRDEFIICSILWDIRPQKLTGGDHQAHALNWLNHMQGEPTRKTWIKFSALTHQLNRLEWGYSFQ